MCCTEVLCIALQCVAACCSVSQRVAACRTVLQRVEPCYSMLKCNNSVFVALQHTYLAITGMQCVAVCCSVQCVAVKQFRMCCTTIHVSGNYRYGRG